MLQSGVRLGPYEILGPLGAGGMGEVYRARDSRLNRDVAIKIVPPSVAENPEARARALRAGISCSRGAFSPQHPHHLRRRTEQRSSLFGDAGSRGRDLGSTDRTWTDTGPQSR